MTAGQSAFGAVAVLALWSCLAAAAGAQTAESRPPAPAPAAPKPVRVVPWRGTAPSPMGADTLDVHDILSRRTSHLDSLLDAEIAVYDTTGLDSLVSALDRGGAKSADQIKPRKPITLHLSPRLGVMSTYDRVNGFRLGSGIETRLGRLASVNTDAAYAFGPDHWYGAAEFTSRTPWKPLGLVARWTDRLAPFGPNQGEYFTSFAALVAGQDRQDYLHERNWEAGFTLHPVRRTTLGLRYGVRDETSAQATTDFRFFGGGVPIQEPNPAADTRITRAVVLDGTWSARHSLVRAHVEGGLAGGVLGGQFDGSWQAADLRYTPSVGNGGTLSLRTTVRNVAGEAPIQAAAYLGGDGNLRGYERLEYTGRQALSIRAEFEAGLDLLARTGIPVVRALHLQFIPFADAGSTWGSPRAVEGSLALDGRWKSSLGLGLQRHLYYPGFGALRLDISRRTDGGPGGADFWFRILPFEP